MIVLRYRKGRGSRGAANVLRRLYAGRDDRSIGRIDIMLDEPSDKVYYETRDARGGLVLRTSRFDHALDELEKLT